MFFSYEQLVAKDGEFNVIWKLATCNASKLKGISRKQYMQISVLEKCKSIVRHIPTSLGKYEEARSKFSLYVIAHLIFGTTRVLAKQAEFLELDAKAAYDSCQRMVYKYIEDISKDETPRKKRTRVAKVATPAAKDILRSFEEVEDAVVRVALKNQITMNDPVPYRGLDLFSAQDDLAAPTEEERLAMIEHERDQASSSNRTRESNAALLRIDGTEVGATFDISKPLQTPQQELQIPAPGEELQFPQLDEVPFEPGLSAFQPLETLTRSAPEVQLTPRAIPEAAEIDVVAQLPVYRRSPTHTEVPTKRAESFELGEIDLSHIPAATPRRRHRPGAVAIDAQQTYFSLEELKHNMFNYGDTLKSKEDLRVSLPSADSQLTKNMFDAANLLWRRKMATTLSYLFKSTAPPKVSLQEALDIGVAGPIYRGEEKDLWKYASSDESSSRLEAEFLKSPGRSEALVTPKKKPRLEEEPLVFPEPMDILPPLDLDMPPRTPREEDEFETIRRSRLSEAEIAREGFEGISINGGPRPSILLRTPQADGKYGRSGVFAESDFGRSSPTADVAHALQAKILKATCRGTCEFSSIFPPSSTSRSVAAKGFYAVLELLKHNRINAEQEIAYGEILLTSDEVREGSVASMRSESTLEFEQ